METTTENIVDQVVVKIEPLNFLKKLESLMKVLQGFQEKEGDVSLVENAKKLFQSFKGASKQALRPGIPEIPGRNVREA